MRAVWWNDGGQKLDGKSESDFVSLLSLYSSYNGTECFSADLLFW